MIVFLQCGIDKHDLYTVCYLLNFYIRWHYSKALYTVVFCFPMVCKYQSKQGVLFDEFENESLWQALQCSGCTTVKTESLNTLCHTKNDRAANRDTRSSQVIDDIWSDWWEKQVCRSPFSLLAPFFVSLYQSILIFLPLYSFNHNESKSNKPKRSNDLATVHNGKKSILMPITNNWEYQQLINFSATCIFNNHI